MAVQSNGYGNSRKRIGFFTSKMTGFSRTGSVWRRYTRKWINPLWRKLKLQTGPALEDVEKSQRLVYAHSSRAGISLPWLRST